MATLWLLSCLVFSLGVSGQTDSGQTTEFWPGKDCPVDPDIGLDDPNNVYSCKPEEECCTKELKPACCAAMPTDMMIEDQVSLLVPLALIILVLGLFVWFCRSDASLLDGETPCLQKFCGCCGYKKRGDDGHLRLNSHEFGSSVSLKSSKSTVVTFEDDEGIVVEDNAANLEAVLDPQDDQEQDEDNAEQEEAVEDVGEAEAEPEEEEAGEAEAEEEVAAEEETGAEEESPEGGDEAE